MSAIPPNSTSDEVQAALARLIEGEAEPQDDALLAETLRARPELLTQLQRQLRLDALLRLEAEPITTTFVELVASRTQPSADDETAFLGRVKAALPTSARATVRNHTIRESRLSRRSLVATLLGIVLGGLFSSAIFAYVAPAFNKSLTLLQDGFESGSASDVTGLPTEIGTWSGDYTEIVGEQEGMRPATGDKMLRFLGADYEGKSDTRPSRTASIWRLVDLRLHRETFADGGAVAQLTAVFNAQSFPQGRSYFEFVQIHALDAAMAAALRERHWTELNASSLALTRSAGVELDRDPATWQRIDCEQRLPGNTDFLLIEIGLKQMPKTSRSAEFAGHYVDDVRLTLARRPLLP